MLKKHQLRKGLKGSGLIALLTTAVTTTVNPDSIEITMQRPEGDSLIVNSQHANTRLIASAMLNPSPAPAVKMSKNLLPYYRDFLRRETESLEEVRNRGRKNFEIISEIFSAAGLPPELKYLAVVESEMRTQALSRCGARGLWQLMPEIARDMGLKVSSKYDERTMVSRSTKAAAKYLKYLHKEFKGDWLLAIASYNGGPGTVYAAIRKSGSRNFWALQRYLPLESSRHVKRYISTLHYFEASGGITTLTKTETASYEKDYLAWQRKLMQDSLIASINTDSSFL